MGYSRFDPAMTARAAWNAGKNVGTKRPLMQKQINAHPTYGSSSRCETIFMSSILILLLSHACSSEIRSLP